MKIEKKIAILCSFVFLSIVIVGGSGYLYWEYLEVENYPEDEGYYMIYLRDVKFFEYSKDYQFQVMITITSKYDSEKFLEKNYLKLTTFQNTTYNATSMDNYFGEYSFSFEKEESKTNCFSFIKLPYSERPKYIEINHTGTSNNQRSVSNRIYIPVNISCRKDRSFNPGNNPTFSLKGENIQRVMISDLDYDGRNELIYSDFNEGLGILIQNQDGIYDNLFFPTLKGKNPTWFEIYDVTGDGIMDIIVTFWNSKSTYILKGNGDGTFQEDPYEILVNMTQPFDLKIVDINVDGFVDIVIQYGNTELEEDNFPYMDTVIIFYGNNDHNYSEEPNFVLSGVDGYFDVGDLNDDGRLDIAVCGSIYYQHPNGSFGPDPDVDLGKGPNPFIFKESPSGQPSIILGDSKYSFYEESFKRTSMKDEISCLMDLRYITIDNVSSIYCGNCVYIQTKDGRTLLFPNCTGNKAVGDLNNDGLLDLIDRNNIYIQSKDSDKDGIIDEYDLD